MPAVTIDTLVEMVFDNRVSDIHQCLPAKVVSYDPSTQKATVQPLIKYRDRTAGEDSNGLVDRALIQNVPVVMFGTDQCIISVPVKVGSKVLVIFSSADVDTFLLSDNSSTVDPNSVQMYGYKDCFAMPFAPIPFSKAIGSDPSDLVFKMNVGTGNENKVTLKESGDVVVDSPTKFIVNAAQEVNVTAPIAKINASDHVTITSPTTTCTGNLRVGGGVSVANDVQTDAGFSANTHKHIGNLGKVTSSFVP
jgi:hypothetical protein